MPATVVSLYVARDPDNGLLGHFTTSVKAKAELKKHGLSSTVSSGPGAVPAIKVQDGRDAVYYLLASEKPVTVNGKRSHDELLASAKAKLDPDEYDALANHLGSEE